MVKFLKYKDQELPVRLSYRALKVLKGKDIASLMRGEWDDAMFEDLLFAGLVSGHKAEGKELGVKKEDMEDVLDEVFLDFVKLIPEFFPNTKDKKEEGKDEPNREKETLPAVKGEPPVIKE